MTQIRIPKFVKILAFGFLALAIPLELRGATTVQEFFGFPPLSQSPYAGLYLGSDGNFYGTTQQGGAFYGTVFQLSPAGKLTDLNPAGFARGQDLPQAPVVQGPDGQLYVAAAGSYENGALLKVSTNGLVVQDFHVCDSVGGENPYGGLTWGNDGRLYGTAGAGGVSGYGTIFVITTDGVFTKIQDFPGSPDGAAPYCPLAEDNHGNFFGTTYAGGTSGMGTVFKLTAGEGKPPRTLASFTGTSGLAVGQRPTAGLIFGPDDYYLYGTTTTGGTNDNGYGNGYGTVFRIDRFGISMSNLVSFSGSSGAKVGNLPIGGLVADASGSLYGTTSAGGSNSSYGTVYKVSAGGVFSSLVTFRNTNGASPQGTLIWGNDGLLYGTTSSGGAYGAGTAFSLTTNGNLATFYQFGEPTANSPSELLLGRDGNYYATSPSGGQTANGVLFRLTPNGLYTSLASFNVTNGASPNGGVVQDPSGVLYGTTYSGGAAGDGTVFKCTTAGELTTLFSFDAALNYGTHPQSKLVFGNDGKLYGTTYDGTLADGGTVFRIDTNGALTNLVSFAGNNGYNPYADLALGADGNLYGTTEAGGANSNGTIFKISLPSGAFTSLASFGGGANGEKPEGRLTWGNDGNLYGTTRFGGIGGTNGVLYRVTTNGTITPLVSFDFTSKGSQPFAGLLLANDSNFYGTTSLGGTNAGGTVFRLTPSGQFSIVVSLGLPNYPVPPSVPMTALIQAADGSLLGTTTTGGSFRRGAVFRLSLGLNPLAPPAQPAFVSALFASPSQFVMTLSSAPSGYWPVSVYASSNLTTWSAIATNVNATNGYYVVTDAQTTNFARRFYRATSL